MSVDSYEAEQEAAYDEFVESLADELYEEHKDRAIDEFVEDRLQSYYLKKADIAIDVIQFIKKSKELIEDDPTSSLIYSSAATEVVLKSVLLKPVIFGLVHTESLAELVATMLVKQTAMDRLKELVFGILENYIEFENGFSNYSREGSNLNLWKEREEIHKIRNQVMHRAKFCTKEDAILSYSVSFAFFSLTKSLIKNVGFSIESNGQLKLLVSS